jgi:hypothetical protein
MKTFKELLIESDYPIYHNTYTAAIQAAEDFAIKKGFELDKEEMSDKIGMGPAKPKEGKTNKISLSITKNGKVQKKMLQIQVFNRGTSSNEFELNCYIA